MCESKKSLVVFSVMVSVTTLLYNIIVNNKRKIYLTLAATLQRGCRNYRD